MTYNFSPLQRQGGSGSIPWRRGGKAAGVELADVGRTRSGGSYRWAEVEEDQRGWRPGGRRRRDVAAGGRALLKGASGGGPR
jgi:hypothetical protein